MDYFYYPIYFGYLVFEPDWFISLVSELHLQSLAFDNTILRLSHTAAGHTKIFQRFSDPQVFDQKNKIGPGAFEV